MGIFILLCSRKKPLHEEHVQLVCFFLCSGACDVLLCSNPVKAETAACRFVKYSVCPVFTALCRWQYFSSKQHHSSLLPSQLSRQGDFPLGMPLTKCQSMTQTRVSWERGLKKPNPIITDCMSDKIQSLPRRNTLPAHFGCTCVCANCKHRVFQRLGSKRNLQPKCCSENYCS